MAQFYNSTPVKRLDDVSNEAVPAVPGRVDGRRYFSGRGVLYSLGVAVLGSALATSCVPSTRLKETEVAERTLQDESSLILLEARALEEDTLSIVRDVLDRIQPGYLDICGGDSHFVALSNGHFNDRSQEHIDIEMEIRKEGDCKYIKLWYFKNPKGVLVVEFKKSGDTLLNISLRPLIRDKYNGVNYDLENGGYKTIALSSARGVKIPFENSELTRYLETVRRIESVIGR